MNAAIIVPARWTARRWIYTIGVVFVAKAGLLLYLDQREQAPPVRPIFRTAVQLVADPWSAEQLDRHPGVSDPTLFALPGPDGFSGAASTNAPPLDHQPKRWSEPPRWLTLAATAFADDFARYTATNSVVPPLVADKPPPSLQRYEPVVVLSSLPSQSRLRVEGRLADRPLLQALDLPSWTHSDLLSNTVIRVTVDADGRTVSSVLLGECGRRDADLLALQLAAAARFQPLSRAARDAAGPGHLAWGRLIFQWHTLPLNATNPAMFQP